MEAGEIQGYWQFGGYCQRQVMQGEADRKEYVTGILVTYSAGLLPPPHCQALCCSGLCHW